MTGQPPLWVALHQGYKAAALQVADTRTRLETALMDAARNAAAVIALTEVRIHKYRLHIYACMHIYISIYLYIDTYVYILYLYKGLETVLTDAARNAAVVIALTEVPIYIYILYIYSMHVSILTYVYMYTCTYVCIYIYNIFKGLETALTDAARNAAVVIALTEVRTHTHVYIYEIHK